MSATTSATYEAKSWSHNDQIEAAGVTSGPDDYSHNQWSDPMFETIADASYYPPLIYTTSNGQLYGHQGAAFNGSTLQPTSTVSPSTAHDPFSPSDYASDAAVLGDAPSDYSPSGFDPNFADYNSSQMMHTVAPSSLLSSPEIAHSQAISHELNLPTSVSVAAAADVSPLHVHQPQPTFSAVQSIEARAEPRPVQPQLVVTIDDYEDGLGRHDDPQQHIRRRNSSKAHLSPYPDDESSDEEENEQQPGDEPLEPVSDQQATVRPVVRNGVRTGIAPDNRGAMNSDEMPSLDDLEEQQRREERNAEVEDWLTNNDLRSNDENGSGTAPRRSKAKSRPRAKSTNDSPHGNLGLYNSQGSYNLNTFPGPGLTINVPSEMDEEEDYDDGSEPDSPPAAVIPTNGPEGYFSVQVPHSIAQHHTSTSDGTTKPAEDIEKAVTGITANMAIMRFRQRAKDTDSASVTATLGSRRMSESDVGSIRGAAGISKLLLSPQQTERMPVRRKNSFLDNILPNRNNSSNKLKRKNSHPIEQADNANASGAGSPKETQGGFAPPKRIGSFGRPKTPKVDTSVPSAASDARSPKAVATAASGAIKQIWRSRSRSDLGKSPKLGLAELMTQHGGPPMPTLASPLQNRVETNAPTAGLADDDSDNEDAGIAGDGLTMDLSVRTDMHIIPTYDGFKYQARQLNPRLADFLLERITQEQVKRYKRLVDLKSKHSQHATSGSCSSKAFCLQSGGQSKDLPPRPGNKDPDSALVGFQIMRPGMTEDDLEVGHDGQQMVAAQFPTGVPLPPVNRLPAEFECPLCFKVKKFNKPSDWTKHVHEDVQPFTCTFANCNEPKSFKRKADWVRHENERHRQLEYWVCSVQECNHTCYRKDNFVQHLVREHKVPEPKLRNGRATGSKMAFDNSPTWQNQAALSAEGVEDVWALVDKCHRDSTKQPKDEACKFCGNICTSWKKLTVHLAKHMEQISMPILPLVEHKKTTMEFPNQRTPNMSNMPQPMPVSTKPLSELPTFLCDEPMSFEAEPQSMMPIDQGLMPGMMHSYPPPNMAIQAQMAATQADLTASNLSMAGSSYPPPSIQSRSRGSSFNEQDFTRQGTTYPPPGMHSRTMSSASPPHFENNSNQPMFFSQPAGMFMQEPIAASNVYLTPTSNTPASLGYSPEGSTHSLHQTYGFPR